MTLGSGSLASGPVRVLHLIGDREPRGSHRFAVELADAQQALGLDVAVAAMSGRDSVPGETLDIDVIDLDGPSLLQRRRVRQRVAGVDVVVTHGPGPGEACSRLLGGSVPFVYRHIRDTRGWTPRPPMPSGPRYLKRAAAVVALSSGSRADLIDRYGLRPAHVKVIPTGIDVAGVVPASATGRLEARERLGISPSTFAVVAAGPLVAAQGGDVLIRAVAPMDDTVVVFTGSGPERDRWALLADGLAPGKVIFASGMGRSGAAEACAVADVLVRPSTWGDSLPRSLMEAAACSLPIVATSTGSMEAIVRPGGSGILVQSGDVEALRTALVSLRDDPAERELLGRGARAVVAGMFDLRAVAQTWNDLLASIASSAREG